MANRKLNGPYHLLHDKDREQWEIYVWADGAELLRLCPRVTYDSKEYIQAANQVTRLNRRWQQRQQQPE